MGQFGVWAKICVGEKTNKRSHQAQLAGDFIRQKWRSYGNSDNEDYYRYPLTLRRGIPMQKQRPTVGILLFDDVEVLDFCGPFEVFSTARLDDADKQGDEHGLFRVFTIAEQGRILSCRGDLLVQPHAIIKQHPPLDILVVPGSHGTRRERPRRAPMIKFGFSSIPLYR